MSRVDGGEASVLCCGDTHTPELRSFLYSGGVTWLERTADKPTHSSDALFLVLALLISVIIFIAGILVYPLNETLGIHVATGAFFLFLTIGILDRLIDRMEKRRKEPLKKELISEISTTVGTILDFVLNLIDVSESSYPYGSEDKFHSALHELAQRENIKLSKLALPLIYPEPNDPLTKFLLHDELFGSAEELGELATKSLDVLESPVCASLLRIRDSIRNIRSDCRFEEETGGLDEDIMKKRLSGAVSAILREIHWLDEMKIPLYKPKTDH